MFPQQLSSTRANLLVSWFSGWLQVDTSALP
jgi:hypothetical protein